MGKYEEVGEKFKILYKKGGFNTIGKPFSLYYDGEYKEKNADVEACIRVKKKKPVKGLTHKNLSGGEGLTIIHTGAYEDIGKAYQEIFHYCNKNNIKFTSPIREEYIKGPGLIFKGNPKKYITKIMLLIEK